MKGQSKITKAKVILLRKGLDIWQYVGDTQIPSDMGTPFLYVYFLSFLKFKVAESTED